MENLSEQLKDKAEIYFLPALGTHEPMSDKEIDEFMDSLSTTQFESITEFFQTAPKLRHVINVTNPKTKKKSEVVLEGLQDFLE